MKIIDVAKVYRSIILHVSNTFRLQKSGQFLEGQYRGEIIRNVHSIEKGLSIDSPRKMFGIPKIEEMLELSEKYMLLPGYSKEVILMVEDSVQEYLEFHSDVDGNDKLKKIKKKYESLRSIVHKENNRKYGGTIMITQKPCSQYQQLKQIIEARHSIRDFSDESIPMEDLRKAIELAKRCPTACNRQGVRIHIIPREKKNCMDDWVSGIGGFTDKVDKYIVITGKVSEYREDEQFQYAISASIFAGYLSLTLQSVGIGACCRLPRYLTKPRQRRSEWDMAGSDGISRVSTVFRGKSLLTNKMRII